MIESIVSFSPDMKPTSYNYYTTEKDNTKSRIKNYISYLDEDSQQALELVQKWANLIAAE